MDQPYMQLGDMKPGEIVKVTSATYCQPCPSCIPVVFEKVLESTAVQINCVIIAINTIFLHD